MIEFALVLMIFLTFFLGVMDFARMLWTWNAANEATRWGARTAVVCPQGSDKVLDRMQKFLPQLTKDNVVVDWYDAAGNQNNACTATNCGAVNVRIQNLNYQWISPIGFSLPNAMPMPGFSTYLPREAMGTDPNSASVCSVS
ncbi:MAG: pilus assembly protein [Comamonas sp.]|jgi:hypothetical protein|uniref:TadE/TadG family type IV pilus assembly protein n=1 Tax=Comamonas sp. TaxID=34028 RepID=UPI0028373B85|nr:TadE/TadG family type IV pilus assembly protein [Comamonas sp.]MDR0216302.1 pilus assembly protein [Comamonas sp.]